MMLRGVVVGLGLMGSNHLRVLQSLPDVAIAAIVDPSEPSRAKAVKRHPGVPAYATLSEALAQIEPGFACLAAPVAQLPALAHETLTRGIPTLVEKPMAISEDEARGIVRTSQDLGVLLGVGYVERYNPAVRALKQKIDRGAIGRVYQVHARRLSPFPRRDSMVGVSLDLASHDIDVMRYLLGSEVDRVFAETEQRVHDHGEDMISATLRFRCGATGLLDVNWVTPTKVRELSVTGENGMFVVDYLTQDLRFYESPRRAVAWDALAGVKGPDEGDMIRYALERREPLRVEWEAFLEAVRDGRTAPVGADDALAALSTALAIQASGLNHEVVIPNYRDRVTF